LLRDNEVSDHEEAMIFDRSDPARRVVVPMKRYHHGSYVKVRTLTEDEVQHRHLCARVVQDVLPLDG
jgi:hypothetical protein